MKPGRCHGRLGKNGERRCRRQAVTSVRWSPAAMRVCWGADWSAADVCAMCRDRIDELARHSS